MKEIQSKRFWKYYSDEKNENNYFPTKSVYVIIINSIQYYAWKDVLLFEYL